MEAAYSKLKKIIDELDAESSSFTNKQFLDILTLPSEIINREDKMKELTRYLVDYKKGYVVPFISVYGKSGSGKSAVIKYVTQNLPFISVRFVNLRKSKTVFGCANLILAEFGRPNVKSAQGVNAVFDLLSDAIVTDLISTNNKLFVLVLDEFDVLFDDKRGKPSDFLYKLVLMQETLRERGYLVCVIAISNNVISEYEIDDRVKSRIGTSEIFFRPYYKKEILAILEDRAWRAFANIDHKVLEHCASISYEEHGDARRAIDLLRTSAEIAGSANEILSTNHVHMASEQLQKDRIEVMLNEASPQFNAVTFAFARLTYLTDQDWHYTSSIYKQYQLTKGSDTKLLSYRRVSELLKELENVGLAVSKTSSRGRYGYGNQHKLKIAPEVAGKLCDFSLWVYIEDRKKEYKKKVNEYKRRNYFVDADLTKHLALIDQWNEFVGFDES